MIITILHETTVKGISKLDAKLNVSVNIKIFYVRSVVYKLCLWGDGENVEEEVPVSC